MKDQLLRAPIGGFRRVHFVFRGAGKPVDAGKLLFPLKMMVRPAGPTARKLICFLMPRNLSAEVADQANENMRPKGEAATWNGESRS